METQEPSDFDIAIVDVLKTIIEVLAGKRLATHEEFALPLRDQLQRARERNAVGAEVFQVLLAFCESRAPVHSLHRSPPGGSA
jgi:hypothetical protein